MLRVVLFQLVGFFFDDPATPEIYTLSLHDALPISSPMVHTRFRSCPGESDRRGRRSPPRPPATEWPRHPRSEEHTSELQSRFELVCRLLLEKKKPSIFGSHETYTSE